MNIVPLEEIPEAKRVPENFKVHEMYKMCIGMRDLCLELKGIGISAVQVGIPLNLYLIVVNKDDWLAYYNCDYEPIYGVSQRVNSREGCLSIPNKEYWVPRWDVIMHGGCAFADRGPGRVPGIKRFERKIDGELSIVHQHECDHSSGVLISQIGKEINEQVKRDEGIS